MSNTDLGDRDKLASAVKNIRSKAVELCRRGLNETSTRIIVIDPILTALGWDVTDIDEVAMEQCTVDGKRVDYALKLDEKLAMVVEAKAINDSLNDVKWITQVVGYTANEGINWCILTNGLKWLVYKATEACPAPDKLLFEVSIDPREDGGELCPYAIDKLWQLSQGQVASGYLDALGERTFIDAKVGKALDSLMRESSRSLTRAIKRSIGESGLSSRRITDSLRRVWAGIQSGQKSCNDKVLDTIGDSCSSASTAEATLVYDEGYHLRNSDPETVSLYHSLDQFCLSLKPDVIDKNILAVSIKYSLNGTSFCHAAMRKSCVLVYLRLKYDRLPNPPSFARDVSNIGHWGGGDLELRINNLSQLDEIKPLIRESLVLCPGLEPVKDQEIPCETGKG